MSDYSADSNSSDGDASTATRNSGNTSPTKSPSAAAGSGAGSPSKRAKPNLSVDTGLANEMVDTLMASARSSKNGQGEQVESLESALKKGEGNTKGKKKVSPTSASTSTSNRRGSMRVSMRLKQDEDVISLLNTSGGSTRSKPPLHGGQASGRSASRHNVVDKDDVNKSQPRRRRTLSSLATIAQEFLPEGQLSDRSPGEWRANDDKFTKLGFKP